MTNPAGSAGSLAGAGTGVGDPAQPVLDKIAEDIGQFRAKTDNVVDPIQTVKTDLTQVFPCFHWEKSIPPTHNINMSLLSLLCNTH